MLTLHLMTQRDQPYGSVRKCCEMCGVMLVPRPDSFWLRNTWTDDPSDYTHWSGSNLGEELTPCLTSTQPP